VSDAESAGCPAKCEEDSWENLRSLRETVQAELAPLFYVNDMRSSGDTAHSLITKKISKALSRLGLPSSGLTRISFLTLMKTIRDGVGFASNRIIERVKR